MSWDADLYMRFGEERTRPAVDLASRIDVRDPDRVIDLGCGPGNSTQVLHARWLDADITGLDSSAEMIAKARAEYPDQGFVLGDIAAWSPDARYDVVFSNAALQWVPGHDRLVVHLLEQVAEGGALAFQIPRHTDSPLHRAILEIADDPAWRDRLHEARGALTIEDPAFYYDALAGCASAIDIWETEYHHVMDGPAAIVEWISSTGLRPFLSTLADDAQRERFMAMLTERASRDYPPRADGNVLFPFNRLFVVARR